jgi:hypothetical protein
MGVQSTQTISRAQAILRIHTIVSLKLNHDYKGIENFTSDPDYSIEEFIKTDIIDINNVNKWTNSMLAKQMDKPFYRFSMFDNYTVEE